ncbi:MAG: DNA repair protein RecO [Candidatus Delongbacteria bacterium]|nr:DNA repair protein RecO [Candidatus Delongbacteria bacterium]
MITEIKTEGIILKSSVHGENSRLINFLTPDFGMIPIIKHGFTSKKNTGRSILQPMNYVKLEILREKNKYKIIDFELMKNYSYIRDHYEKTTVVLNIFAVLNTLPLNDLDGNRMTFFLVKKLLEATDMDHEFSSQNTEIYFYFQLAWCLGIKFTITDNCINCNSNNITDYLDMTNGNLHCKKCKNMFDHSFPISEKLSTFLKSISKIKFEELYKIKPQKEYLKKEFINMFNTYTNFHINYRIAK